MNRIGKNNPMYGKHHSAETKAKLRAIMCGKCHTEETKAKIRMAKLGIKMPPRSEEYRQNVSKIHKGKILSDETKKKMSLAKKGQPSSRKGVKLSEETKQKLREANLGKKLTREVREKISNGLKGKTTWNKGKKYSSKVDVKMEKNPNWKGGISFELYSINFTEVLKETIRARDGYTCQECGIHQDNMNSFYKKLDVHHIDYDKNNNNQDNLISLCRSCHAKTSFTREDWVRYFKNKMVDYG